MDFIHIGKEEDIPAGLIWTPCIRIATEQEYTIPDFDFSVETIYGTMNGRARCGDALMRGATGSLYVIRPEDRERCYRDKYRRIVALRAS